MVNRVGEFALIIDPGNDGHVVRSDHVSRMVSALTKTIRLGFELLGERRARRIAIYHTASPEYGSVKFNLLAAATVASAGLSVAANASQVTGVDLSDVFKGMARVLAQSTEPVFARESPEARLAGDTAFILAVTDLVGATSRSGYGSVKVTTPSGGIIELATDPPPPPPTLAEADRLAKLRAELAELEAALERLGIEQPARQSEKRPFPGAIADNLVVRRADIAREIKTLEKRAPPRRRESL